MTWNNLPVALVTENDGTHWIYILTDGPGGLKRFRVRVEEIQVQEDK